MIPASFASMILKFVLPEVREILVRLFKYKDEPNDADIRLDKVEEQIKMDIIEHIFKVGKIKESIEYRELPNDADRIGEKNQEHIKMLAGELSAQDDRLKKLETMSNKPKKVK